MFSPGLEEVEFGVDEVVAGEGNQFGLDVPVGQRVPAGVGSGGFCEAGLAASVVLPGGEHIGRICWVGSSVICCSFRRCVPVSWGGRLTPPGGSRLPGGGLAGNASEETWGYCSGFGWRVQVFPVWADT